MSNGLTCARCYSKLKNCGCRRNHGKSQFRVWPDGTVQAVEDGEPYSHMSDDYAVVWAHSEDEARSKV